MSKKIKQGLDPQLIRDGIKEIEDTGRIELFEALERLKENDDFKALFLKEFFVDYPMRCVRLREDPSISFGEMSEAQIARLDAIIRASGVVQVWFKQLEAEGMNANAQIEDLKEELKKVQAGK